MNKRVVVWMAVCTTRLSRHSAVFNYTLISSHHRERGFESIWRQEGGSLFTLVVVFSLFVVVQSWFKGFVSGDKRGSGTDWGPPHPVCLCLPGSMQTHISTLHRKTHPLTAAYFLPSEGLLLRLHVCLSPSLPKGSPLNKGKRVCFCLGCRPQAILIMALFRINEGSATPLHSSPFLHSPVSVSFSVL